MSFEFLLRLPNGTPQRRGHRSRAERSQGAVLDRRWTCGQGTWLSAEEFASARWEEIRKDLKAPVIRRETLMTMKRMAARPQDLADIAELEEIQKLKEG